ncbi:tetratricopeptide repeat protein [bacterium]|nr:MAG: tetratricopeptide repeat protein [bacterium]
MKKHTSIIWLGVFILFMLCGCFSFAQEDNSLAMLSKKILESSNPAELSSAFEQIKDIYFKDKRYSQMPEFIKSLGQKKKGLDAYVSYYTALSVFKHLKYLEETQKWDEYFSDGDNYRDQIDEELNKVVQATTPKDILNIQAQFLLYEFHKAAQDGVSEQILSDLVKSTTEYAQNAGDPKVIKDIADKLIELGEKNASKGLYRLYVNKITGSEIKDDELNGIAKEFFVNGNLELSEAVYDKYIERIEKALPKEELISTLIKIARMFSYKDEGYKDSVYAGRIFKKIEEYGAKDIFDEELLYMRAFNLEKSREYKDAVSVYAELIARFPESLHADQSLYKIGMLSAYGNRDIDKAREYFEKLASKDIVNPWIISGLYQLGLLSQWQENNVKAKEYYDKLIEKAKYGFAEMAEATKNRLSEIAEVKPLEYNLKTFIDLSLKNEHANFDMSKSELKSSLYAPKKDQELNISSAAYLAESGCMQAAVQYLWSGNTGKKKPAIEEPGFSTSYAEEGTKEINLVIVASSGMLDRNFDLIDVE